MEICHSSSYLPCRFFYEMLSSVPDPTTILSLGSEHGSLADIHIRCDNRHSHSPSAAPVTRLRTFYQLHFMHSSSEVRTQNFCRTETVRNIAWSWPQRITEACRVLQEALMSRSFLVIAYSCAAGIPSALIYAEVHTGGKELRVWWKVVTFKLVVLNIPATIHMSCKSPHCVVWQFSRHMEMLQRVLQLLASRAVISSAICRSTFRNVHSTGGFLVYNHLPYEACRM